MFNSRMYKKYYPVKSSAEIVNMDITDKRKLIKWLKSIIVDVNAYNAQHRKQAESVRCKEYWFIDFHPDKEYICILFSGTNNRIANFMEDEHMEQITRVQIQESIDTYVKTYITDAEWHISLVEDFMHLLTGNSFNITDLQNSRLSYCR